MENVIIIYGTSHAIFVLSHTCGRFTTVDIKGLDPWLDSSNSVFLIMENGYGINAYAESQSSDLNDSYICSAISLVQKSILA